MWRRISLFITVFVGGSIIVFLLLQLKTLEQRRLIDAIDKKIDVSRQYICDSGKCDSINHLNRIESSQVNGHNDKLSYFYENSLIAVDLFDELGKVVRRDAYDHGTKRLEIFFSRGKPILVRELTPDGRTKSSTSAYVWIHSVPFGGY